MANSTDDGYDVSPTTPFIASCARCGGLIRNEPEYRAVHDAWHRMLGEIHLVDVLTKRGD